MTTAELVGSRVVKSSSESTLIQSDRPRAKGFEWELEWRQRAMFLP